VIHAACSSNNIEIVEYLLNKRRVNPNLKGKDDWSPLEIAIQSGFFQLANILLEDKRTNINQVTSEMRGSNLHLAAKSGYLPICQILLLKSVDLGIRDINGHLAKEVTSNPQIRNLIEKYEEQKLKS
jgi:ankyrin repeat protein